MFVSHLHGDHFGGLPFLILDGQFARRTAPLLIAGPPGTRQRLTEAMECLFPGSTQVRRRFDVTVVELSPGEPKDVAGVGVRAWEASHPSGAPALILRLTVGGTVIAYTGDTAWTPAIARRPTTPTCSSPRRTTGTRPSAPPAARRPERA